MPMWNILYIFSKITYSDFNVLKATSSNACTANEYIYYNKELNSIQHVEHERYDKKTFRRAYDGLPLNNHFSLALILSSLEQNVFEERWRCNSM